MIHKLLFRGQTRRKGEKITLTGDPVCSNWVYGGVFQGDGDFSIIYSYDPLEKFTVYTNTLCRYTGLKDKNDTMIFEYDIVETKYGRVCKVVWFSSPSYCGWDLVPIKQDEPICMKPDRHDLWYADNLEVVGNIFDDLVEDHNPT